jgi:putative transposase
VVTTAARREVVEFCCTSLKVSERRACRLVGAHRSTARYRTRRPPAGPLRQRLRELAAARPRFGYRRLAVLLRREGMKVNHKRVHRLYRLEGLALRRRRRKRVRGTRPMPLAAATSRNERWSMDFVSDYLTTGRRFRCCTLVDVFSRESPAIEVDFSLPGPRVVRMLDEVAATRGYPQMLVVDNGPEFISSALDKWAYEHSVTLHFIEPGKPVQNAHIESFNGKFRDECLQQNHFPTIAWARIEIGAWRVDYNTVRPHSALGYLSPAEFVRNLIAGGLPPDPRCAFDDRAPSRPLISGAQSPEIRFEV